MRLGPHYRIDSNINNKEAFVQKIIHSSLLTVVFAVVLYGGFTLYSGGSSVLESAMTLGVTPWAIILLLSFGNYLIRYWRWYLYISHQNPLSMSHVQHLAIYIAGFSLTMTPGKAGEAMRSLYLKDQGVSHQRSLGALFVERVMDLLAVLLLAALGLSFLTGAQAQLAAFVTLSLIVICLVVVKIPKQAIMASRFIQALPNKLRQTLLFVESMLEHANDLLSIRFIIIGLVLGVIAWGLEGYGLFVVMQNFQLDQTSLFLAVAIYAAAVLIGAVSFLPGGLGGAEAAMFFMLMKVGFPAPEATAITFICRLATLWFAVALGLLMMLLLKHLGLTPRFSNEVEAS